jgi:hypothetical protein
VTPNFELRKDGYCCVCRGEHLAVVHIPRELPDSSQPICEICEKCIETMRLQIGRLTGRWCCPGIPGGDPDHPPDDAHLHSPLAVVLSSSPSDGGIRFAVSSDLVREMFLDEARAYEIYHWHRPDFYTKTHVCTLTWLASQVVPDQQFELTPAQFEQVGRLMDNSGANDAVYSVVRALARLAQHASSIKEPK